MILSGFGGIFLDWLLSKTRNNWGLWTQKEEKEE